MRLVTIKSPQGESKKIAQLAFEAGAKQVSIHQAVMYYPDKAPSTRDVTEIEAPTPVVRQFIESFMASPFYDPATYSFTIRHPESLFGSEPPETETYPIVRPTTDVYQELWQFSRVTYSLAGRVFLSAILLSFGMVKMHLPLMLAGLLFLPYHHHMLSTALGACIREWRFFRQGLLALLTSTIMIMLAGMCVALFTEPPVEYDKFGTPAEGLALAIIIGIAAGLASVDDAGRRELIGLAATAHISIFPAWLGLQLVFGTAETSKIIDHLLVFLMNISVLILAAGLTYFYCKDAGRWYQEVCKECF